MIELTASHIEHQPPGVERRGWIAALVLLIAGGVAARGAAEDTVQARGAEGGKAVHRGEIVQYDERGVSLKLANGKILNFEPSRIIAVLTKFSTAHQTADEAMQQRDYARAATFYERALAEEKRLWAQRRIRSGLVVALRRSDQLRRAGEEFLQLAADRTDAEIMAIAPLIWLPNETIPPDAVQTAQRWSNDQERPLAMLLAASWLLGTDEREKAGDILGQLETHTEQRIGWLARAQTWRTKLATAPRDEIDRFRDLIQKMPEGIRAGPQYLLGRAYEAKGAPVDAALALLWVPFVYESQDRSDLAADALLRAGQASERAGLPSDAQKIYREVVEKYPGTTWATAADQNEKRLQPKRPKTPSPQVAPTKASGS